MNKLCLAAMLVVFGTWIPTCFASYNCALVNGFYVGAGGSWNTIDESSTSLLATSTSKAAFDNYHTDNSRLAPSIILGYWQPLCREWLWGVSGQWKYLGYYTPNVDSDRGQHIPNATFSSINFFGPKIERDFSAETRISNELLALVYFGFQVCRGYTYLGIGPAWFTTNNSIYVNSVHIPNGSGDTLITTSVNKSKWQLGGAIQVGYNYYVSSCCFLGISYCYSHTGKHHYNNVANTAQLNGFDVAGPTTLDLNRSNSLNVQEVMLSINRVF